MPRYYFHVHDGHDMPGHDGADLPDIRAVRVQAVQTAGEMVRDMPDIIIGQEWRMDVTDEAGEPVLTLRFSAVEHTG